MTLIKEQKKEQKRPAIILLEGASVLLLLAMFILPFLSIPGYSVTVNTLSELGAQSSPGSWVMNLIFAALALTSVISGWECFEGFIFHRIILILFSVSLILAAVFNHAPVSPDVQYNIREGGWHSYFICTTWITFSILTFSTSLILEKPADRILSNAAGLSALLLMLLFSEADRTAGIWQRLLFIISFGWMIYTFKTLHRQKLNL
jgi:hypothetical protein